MNEKTMADEEAMSINPWEKVVKNIELDQARYVGDKDVSRMRQSIIARKNDLNKN
jgi:hypothetical protein